MKKSGSQRIELGEQVAQEMERLWQNSVRDVDRGVVREYAATLVEGHEGELKLVNVVEGSSRQVTPNLAVAEDERLVGTFHTHPYENGTQAAFSGQDIAAALESQERISLVRSGDEVFALVRTNKTPQEMEAAKVNQDFDEEFIKHAASPNVSFKEAIYLANIELCRRYGLAFYRSKGGTLREVYRP